MPISCHFRDCEALLESICNPRYSENPDLYGTFAEYGYKYFGLKKLRNASVYVHSAIVHSKHWMLLFSRCNMYANIIEWASYWSPRLAYIGVYYFFCRWLCLSVRLSRTNFRLILLFVSRWNWAIFCRQVSMCPSTKRCSSIFDLRPITPKIYSQKFAQNRL